MTHAHIRYFDFIDKTVIFVLLGESKAEAADDAGNEGESGASDPNPHPKPEKDAPTSVSVSVKGDVSKNKRPAREAQIKELKEFSNTFKLGPDSDSKKSSESSTPPGAQAKSSTSTPPSSGGNTTPGPSDKGSKPGEKKDKDAAAEAMAEYVFYTYVLLV